MPVRRKRIQEVVEKLLRENKVTTVPVPVDHIAKTQGIELVYQAYEEDEICGFLYRDPRRAVIGVNRGHHPHRKRFTIAHELGHFFLHHEEGNGKVHIDKAFHVVFRDETSKDGEDADEIEANAFAAELLMPASFVRRDMVRLGALDVEEDAAKIKELADRYKVSTQALLIRLNRLGYVSL